MNIAKPQVSIIMATDMMHTLITASLESTIKTFTKHCERFSLGDRSTTYITDCANTTQQTYGRITYTT